MAGLLGVIALSLGRDQMDRAEMTARFANALALDAGMSPMPVDVALPTAIIFGWLFLGLAGMLLMAALIGYAVRR